MAYSLEVQRWRWNTLRGCKYLGQLEVGEGAVICWQKLGKQLCFLRPTLPTEGTSKVKSPCPKDLLPGHLPEVTYYDFALQTSASGQGEKSCTTQNRGECCRFYLKTRKMSVSTFMSKIGIRGSHCLSLLHHASHQKIFIRKRSKVTAFKV